MHLPVLRLGGGEGAGNPGMADPWARFDGVGWGDERAVIKVEQDRVTSPEAVTGFAIRGLQPWCEPPNMVPTSGVLWMKALRGPALHDVQHDIRYGFRVVFDGEVIGVRDDAQLCLNPLSKLLCGAQAERIVLAPDDGGRTLHRLKTPADPVGVLGPTSAYGRQKRERDSAAMAEFVCPRFLRAVRKSMRTTGSGSFANVGPSALAIRTAVTGQFLKATLSVRTTPESKCGESIISCWITPPP